MPFSGSQLCQRGAAGGFLAARGLCRAAQTCRALQERFLDGSFPLRLRFETNQLSRFRKDPRSKDEILREVLAGLQRFRRSPLRSLRIYEPKALRELLPIILELLRLSPSLELFSLNDLSISPIRGPSAAGAFDAQTAAELLPCLGRAVRDPCRQLRQLDLTAGIWTWTGLGMLFKGLATGSLRRVRLRGKLEEPQEDAPEPLVAVSSVSYFAWMGADILVASLLELLVKALPNADIQMRMEMCGAWGGPGVDNVRAFEDFVCRAGRRIWAAPKGVDWKELHPGISIDQGSALRTMLNLYFGDDPNRGHRDLLY